MNCNELSSSVLNTYKDKSAVQIFFLISEHNTDRHRKSSPSRDGVYIDCCRAIFNSICFRKSDMINWNGRRLQKWTSSDVNKKPT